ncbi:MAG: hypothetical protein IPJ06_03295 [Saprospiraceae bacterium]|jgi:hypothetical protein|nr:hypothetical protein [Saprospiraceae bacterium]
MYLGTHKCERFQLVFFDSQEKHLGPAFKGILDPARHEFEWRVGDLPSGTYFLRLQNRGEFVVEQMVVK